MTDTPPPHLRQQTLLTPVSTPQKSHAPHDLEPAAGTLRARVAEMGRPQRRISAQGAAPSLCAWARGKQLRELTVALLVSSSSFSCCSRSSPGFLGDGSDGSPVSVMARVRPPCGFSLTGDVATMDRLPKMSTKRHHLFPLGLLQSSWSEDRAMAFLTPALKAHPEQRLVPRSDFFAPSVADENPTATSSPGYRCARMKQASAQLSAFLLGSVFFTTPHRRGRQFLWIWALSSLFDAEVNAPDNRTARPLLPWVVRTCEKQRLGPARRWWLFQGDSAPKLAEFPAAAWLRLPFRRLAAPSSSPSRCSSRGG